MDTPMMDFDYAVAMEILRRHLGSSFLVSFKDNSIIIETGGNVVSLNCGKPDEFIGEWYLHSVKGEKLRLDNPILEPMKRGIKEFLNRDLPLDKDEDCIESAYRGPIPDWFQEGFGVDYFETPKSKEGKCSESRISYRIVRNRAGSLMIKNRMADDLSVSQYVMSIDEYYDEKAWWNFHMPISEMKNEKIEIDTIIYSRIGPKKIRSPIGNFECIGFNFDGWEKCSCAEGEKPGPGVCIECKGKRYLSYFPPMKCSECNGTGVCSRCDGNLILYRRETYWYDSQTGFFIKVELHVSNRETTTMINKIEPSDLLTRIQ